MCISYQIFRDTKVFINKQQIHWVILPMWRNYNAIYLIGLGHAVRVNNEIEMRALGQTAILLFHCFFQIKSF